MKRSRPKAASHASAKPSNPAKPREPRLARDTQQLITLAAHCAKAGSRYEDVYWEREILSLATKLMAAGKDSTIEAALDSTLGSTLDTDLDAHETLLSFCEAAAECSTIDVDGAKFDALLIAMPMVAWSRYAIPSGPLGENDAGSKTANALMIALHTHVLAQGTRACLSPF